jgi:hypothetical protein
MQLLLRCLHEIPTIKSIQPFFGGLIFSFSLISAADTFSDLESGHDNYIAIEYLVSSGTLEGYSDGTFLPEKEVNRAELMKMLVAGQEISPDESLYKNCFSDVTTDWYAKYVCYAKEMGWVNGYSDGTFKPASTVNKVEALKMIIQAYGYGDRLPDETGIAEALFSDFDSDWELLSNTVVTDYGDDYFGGRPSVMLHDGYAYVTYDKESRDSETKELQRDWQCQMSVYEMME